MFFPIYTSFKRHTEQGIIAPVSENRISLIPVFRITRTRGTTSSAGCSTSTSRARRGTYFFIRRTQRVSYAPTLAEDERFTWIKYTGAVHLAPEIVEAIVKSRQAPEIKLAVLLNDAPLSWAEQNAKTAMVEMK